MEALTRFGCLDIETTNLRATYGRLLCVCVRMIGDGKPTRASVHTFFALNWQDEENMLVDLEEIYEDIDVLVTYNGKLFDMPFVNARRAQWGMKPLRPIKHVDLYWHAKKLLFASRSLNNVSQMLGCKTKKYNVHPKHWVRAANGEQASLDEIVKHCQLDVLLTEEVYGHLKPLIVNITR